MSNCIYCGSEEPEHFICEICGDGMCEACFDAGVEEDKSFHMPLEICEDGDVIQKITEICGREPECLCDKCINKETR